MEAIRQLLTSKQRAEIEQRSVRSIERERERGDGCLTSNWAGASITAQRMSNDSLLPTFAALRRRSSRHSSLAVAVGRGNSPQPRLRYECRHHRTPCGAARYVA
jgi:hypothetical protein